MDAEVGSSPNGDEPMGEGNEFYSEESSATPTFFNPESTPPGQEGGEVVPCQNLVPTMGGRGGKKRCERSPTSSTGEPPQKSAAVGEHSEGGDPQDGTCDMRTDGSEGTPPPPDPMYQGDYCETWNDYQEWVCWRNSVEGRFAHAFAQNEKCEAALFEAAGIEPVVMSNVNNRIEIALQQQQIANRGLRHVRSPSRSQL